MRGSLLLTRKISDVFFDYVNLWKKCTLLQSVRAPELLTTAEAADDRRIKERKLYELVAEQAIPCTRVTGKWLFPRADLDRWLSAGMARPAGVVPADPPPIAGGSHDPLLQWALAQSLCGLALLPEGSEADYRRFLAGEVIAAAVHFHAPDDPELDANVATVAGERGLYDAVLMGFAAREQGLLVGAGNPIGLDTLAAVRTSRARLAIRPSGAGAQ
jgi:excisionase family DNA binding protein